MIQEDNILRASDTVRLRIGDVTMDIHASSPDLALGLTGPSRAFVVSDGRPDIETQARWADLSSDVAAGAPAFNPGQLWTLHRTNGHYTFRFVSPALGNIPYKVGRFSADFRSGEVRLHRDYHRSGGAVYPLEYPLDELVIAHHLALGRGVIQHACGLVDEAGRGLLFAGCSGAGKTTTARLWMNRPGVKILSDDRIIVRQKDDGRFWMFGTPWHGAAEIALPEGAPLSRVFLLVHGTKNELTPLRTADAVRRLFVTCFPPFHHAGSLDFTLAFLERMVGAAPCAAFQFVPEAAAVEFVERT